jgi:hypothetical protein
MFCLKVGLLYRYLPEGIEENRKYLGLDTRPQGLSDYEAERNHRTATSGTLKGFRKNKGMPIMTLYEVVTVDVRG